MSYKTEITIYPSEDLKQRIDRAAEAAGVATSRFITDLLAKKFPSNASVDPTLRAKAIAATEAKFLRDGLETLDIDWDASNGVTFDLIAKDEDEVVFALVDVRDGEMPAEQFDFDRTDLETAAGEWLLERNSGDDSDNLRFRFDSVCFAVMGEGRNKALLRHHKDFMAPWRG